MPPSEVKVAPKPQAASAPAEALLPHETEQARKLALLSQVRSTRASMLAQLAQIEGMKPDKAYIWANIHETRVNRFRSMGYEICKDPDVKSQWRKDDYTHVRGDVILMQVPKELHEAWHYDSELRAIEDLDNSQVGFKEFAARNGVPVDESPLQKR